MDRLTQLKQIAKMMLISEEQEKAFEEQLKTAKANTRRLREETLPSMMQELELNNFELDSGQSFSLTQVIHAKIPAANKDEAFAWLEDHGHSGLIKSTVSIDFPRGQLDKAGELITELEGRQIKTSFKEDVHTGTLKSFIKEQLADPNADPIPLDLFNAYTITQVKVK